MTADARVDTARDARVDIVGIGTSPLMLLRAAALQRAGREVLLLDAHAEPGGAWRCGALFGIVGVELAPHLIENRRPLHALLEAAGVPLADDACLTVADGRATAARLARPLSHALFAGRALVRGEGDKARRLAAAAGRSLASLRQPLRYPVGGAAAMIARLAANFVAAGGRIVPGTRIAAARLDAVRVRIEAEAAGGAVGFDAARLLMASRAHAPLADAAGPIALHLEAGESRSVMLLAEAAPAAPLRYVEFIRHPLVRRLRNLAPFAPSLPPSRLLLVAQLRGSAGGDDAAAARGVLDALARHALIAPGWALVAAAGARHALATIPDARAAAIERRGGGLVEALRTTDLADGFMSQRARYGPPADG